MRLLFHGRLLLAAQTHQLLLHASLDPYNTTEEMDVSWTDMTMTWSEAEVKVGVFVDAAICCGENHATLLEIICTLNLVQWEFSGWVVRALARSSGGGWFEYTHSFVYVYYISNIHWLHDLYIKSPMYIIICIACYLIKAFYLLLLSKPPNIWLISNILEVDYCTGWGNSGHLRAHRQQIWRRSPATPAQS